DGELLDDNSLTFSTIAGSVVIPDALHRYDGDSVPTAGDSRASDGQLWDIHTFDISGAFGPTGPYELNVNGQDYRIDCLGLVLLLVALPHVVVLPTDTPTSTLTPTDTPTATFTPTSTPSPTDTPTSTATVT